MTMKEIREKAKTVGVKVGVGWTKIDAVRAIQTAESYDPCFARGLWNVCGQDNCCFRGDCIKASGSR